MKKFILLLACVVFSTILSAQILNYKANAFSFREPAQKWSEWEPTELIISADFTNNTIGLNSSEPQLFKYSNFTKRREASADVFAAYAVDINSNIALIEWFFNDSKSVFLKISYSNLEYIYNLDFSDDAKRSFY